MYVSLMQDVLSFGQEFWSMEPLIFNNSGVPCLNGTGDLYANASATGEDNAMISNTMKAFNYQVPTCKLSTHHPSDRFRLVCLVGDTSFSRQFATEDDILSKRMPRHLREPCSSLRRSMCIMHPLRGHDDATLT